MNLNGENSRWDKLREAQPSAAVGRGRFYWMLCREHRNPHGAGILPASTGDCRTWASPEDQAAAEPEACEPYWREEPGLPMRGGPDETLTQVCKYLPHLFIAKYVLYGFAYKNIL